MNFATLQTGGFADEDLVKDGWTDISQRIRDRIIASSPPASEFTPETMIGGVRGQRRREDGGDPGAGRRRSSQDPRPRQNAEAWYRQLCKRPCFHDEYLQAYNEPGAHLVDTDGKGVERIDETGVVGRRRALRARLPHLRVGLRGRHRLRPRAPASTRSAATASGSRSTGPTACGRMHGIHVHGFPNLFIVGSRRAPTSSRTSPHNLAEAGTHDRGDRRARARRRRRRRSRSPQEAEDAWMRAAASSPRSALLGNPDCTPGYYNNEGQPAAPSELVLGYPERPVAYFEYIDRWRTPGDFAGLEFR